MAQSYRRSYWKTTLLAAACGVVAAFIASSGLLKGYLNILGWICTRGDHPLIFWGAIVAGFAFSVMVCVVALGGGICLWRDSIERQSR
jgi:hypothetical protein